MTEASFIIDELSFTQKKTANHIMKWLTVLKTIKLNIKPSKVIFLIPCHNKIYG